MHAHRVAPDGATFAIATAPALEASFREVRVVRAFPWIIADARHPGGEA